MPQGKARDDVGVSASGDTIVITLPESLPRGTQVVSYRVISADGHPVAGSMMFSIGAATETASAACELRFAERPDLARRGSAFISDCSRASAVRFSALDRGATPRRLER